MVNGNDDNAPDKRTSKGKQKIEVKKIEKKLWLQLAFSKHHNTFLKKFGSEYPSTFEKGSTSGSCPSTNNNWWERPVDDMSFDGLNGFKVGLEGLRDDLVSEFGRLNCDDDASNSAPLSVLSDASNRSDETMDLTLRLGPRYTDARNVARFSDRSNEITVSVNEGSGNSDHGVQETGERMDVESVNSNHTIQEAGERLDLGWQKL